jgi:acyl carrier protein
VAPETEIEKRLADIWQSVLQRDVISVTANFFEIGGHSLMATKLVTKIRNTFSISFPLSAMFEASSIRSCAVLVENALKEKYAQTLIHGDDKSGASNDEEMII